MAYPHTLVPRPNQYNAKLDTLNTKIDTVAGQLNVRMDKFASQLNEKFDSLNKEFSRTRVWALLMYIALAAVNLGTLARGLGWI